MNSLARERVDAIKLLLTDLLYFRSQPEDDYYMTENESAVVFTVLRKLEML